MKLKILRVNIQQLSLQKYIVNLKNYSKKSIEFYCKIVAHLGLKEHEGGNECEGLTCQVHLSNMLPS